MTNPSPQPTVALYPHLVCAGAADAIAFYVRAFNAVEIIRMPGENGKLMHASVSIDGSIVMLVDEAPAHGMFGPKSLKGTPVTLHLKVDDVDIWFARAVKAGASALMAPADMFWGDRYALIEDPFGHRWSIATPKNVLTPEEMAEAARRAMPAYAKS